MGKPKGIGLRNPSSVPPFWNRFRVRSGLAPKKICNLPGCGKQASAPLDAGVIRPKGPAQDLGRTHGPLRQWLQWPLCW